MSVPTWVHRVTQPELITMLVMSFRYALGRRSTAPSAVSDLLRTYGSILPDWQKEQIAKDISSAIEGGLAGDTCDERTWREVRERMLGDRPPECEWCRDRKLVLDDDREVPCPKCGGQK